MLVAALLESPRWEIATRHPFLRAVGGGTASTSGTWLAVENVMEMVLAQEVAFGDMAGQESG